MEGILRVICIASGGQMRLIGPSCAKEQKQE